MRVSILAAALLAVLVAPVAHATDLPIINPVRILAAQADGVPNEWAGIWNVNVVIKDCGTGFIYGSTSFVDTTCSGDAIDPGDGGENGSECNWSINGSTVTGNCTSSFELFEGCTASQEVDYVSSVSGSTWTATITINTTYSGDECDPELTATCMRSEVTGTKTAPEPTAYCQTPVEAKRWGSIKALYR